LAAPAARLVIPASTAQAEREVKGIPSIKRAGGNTAGNASDEFAYLHGKIEGNFETSSQGTSKKIEPLGCKVPPGQSEGGFQCQKPTMSNSP
jgi:hypothetical protein